MTTAELKTQSALAERIAELEGLDAPPKHLVNRVFREQPVDPQSLERIARALGVPAHTLYQRTGDVVLPAPAETPFRRRTRAAAIAAVVLAIAIGAGLLRQRTGLDEATPPNEPTESAEPPAGSEPLALALLPLDGDVDGVLESALREALGTGFALSSPAAALIVDTDRPDLALARLQVDAAISGQVTRRGRRAGVEIFLSRPSGRRLLWAESFTLHSLAANAAALAQETRRALDIAFGASNETPHYHPSTQALEDYLIAWSHLDQNRTELNVKRALTRFESALRTSPDYPAALAGLCAALTQQSILEGETRYLDDAEPQCFRSLQLDPSNVDALTAWGDLLRKTGRLDEAQQAYARALDAAPRHIDALLGQAELALARYRETQEALYGRAAVDAAREAGTIAPEFWKPLYILGRMLYYTGDIDGAVAALEDAKALDPNEHVLSNLGTFEFCQGDHAGALENYLAVKEMAPKFYVGDVQLGAVHYFLGEYEQAAALFDRALETAREDGQPQDQRIWGNLGDAYRQIGDTEAARRAYTRAAALAERDYAQGDNRANAGAYLAYYYTVLLEYGPTERTEAMRAAVDEQLQAGLEGAADVDALTRLAEALALRGELDPARKLYERITAQCEGFGASPDLAPLRSTPSAD